MVDVAKETAAVSEACALAKLGGHALWVQLGGRMHQARVQASETKCCVVDGGDGTGKLAQTIEEALEAANPDAPWPNSRGQKAHCGATRTWGNC